MSILDDSFEHEVWNEAEDAYRVILLVDVWHPELTAAERDVVRRDLRWVE